MSSIYVQLFQLNISIIFCMTHFMWQQFKYSRLVMALRAGLDETDVKFVTFVFILYLVVALSANKECIRS